MSGQSVTDRLSAVQHSITGSQLSKSVVKATTHEVMGPKKKHLDYLLQCTNEPHVNIPQLADLIIERSSNSSWVVVFKSLVTVHHLMCYGNEEEGELRNMGTEKLLKTLPVVQQQLDALLEFDVTPNELTNGVINSCFMLLFKDCIRLFACYNDGIINLLEKYFDMNKKQCKEGLDNYKKFLIRMDKVSDFLKTAEQVGIDKGEIPDLTKVSQAQAPASLLDALEQHLAAMEGKKGKSERPANLQTSVNALTATGSSFDAAAIQNNSSTTILTTVNEAEKQKFLEEENKRLNALKEQRLKEANHVQVADFGQPTEQRMKELQQSPQQPAQVAVAPPPVTSTNPFLTASPPAAAPPAATTQQLDLFSPPPAQNTAAVKPSDDLLALDVNPFQQIQATIAQQSMAQPQMSAAPQMWGAPAPTNNGLTTSGSPAHRLGQAGLPGNRRSCRLQLRHTWANPAWGLAPTNDECRDETWFPPIFSYQPTLCWAHSCSQHCVPDTSFSEFLQMGQPGMMGQPRPAGMGYGQQPATMASDPFGGPVQGSGMSAGMRPGFPPSSPINQPYVGNTSSLSSLFSLPLLCHAASPKQEKSSSFNDLSQYFTLQLGVTAAVLHTAARCHCCSTPHCS
uniref:ENTH domain-containing protein n=1 Tax=Branchiostoma floridae TaxID=7739 RepID=C3YXU9_BRAFL|eukprot:XP_002598896.1 hypothetical protein BRAFLDRAFT_125739 [Branchiostoma floridae]